MFSLLRGGVGAVLIVAASAAVAFADSATNVAPAAGTSSGSGTAATANPAPDPNKIICRRMEVTGSNLPEHICKTRAEWARLAEQYDRETKDTIRQTRIPGCSAKGC